MDPSVPNCQICCRQPGARLPFYCPTCARNVLYEPRLRNARALLEKEALCAKLENALQDGKSSNSQEDDVGEAENAACLSATYQHLLTQTERSTGQVKDAEEELQNLKEVIQARKKGISEKRAKIVRRKAALVSSKQEISRQEGLAFRPLEKEVEKTKAEWKASQDLRASGALYLCREAASLFGLAHRKRRNESKGRDQYLLGGVPIVDLRNLTTTPTAQVTFSAGRVAQLIYHAAHYLSLKLPAEITLQSSSNTHPSILSPSSSYKDPNLPTGLKNAASLPDSTNASRKRTLFIDKPIGILAAEDPIGYSHFVEAITFLAWDVAWLARTQGLDVATSDWEEVCAMGKTLYTLFGSPGVPPYQRPPYRGTTALNTTSSQPRVPSRPRSLAVDDVAYPLPAPGHISHNSALAFLPAATELGGGADFMRTWPLANPIRLIDRIKGALASERMGAEWEVLQRDEWEGEAEDAAKAKVEVANMQEGGTKVGAEVSIGLQEDVQSEHPLGDEASAIERQPGVGGGDGTKDEEKEGQRQRRGWMRVRSQGVDQ